MRISNKSDGSFPRKSNNMTENLHQGKILRLKSKLKPKDSSITHTNE